MRVSMAVPAGLELVNFNICVWDMLRAIQRLATSYQADDENTPDTVRFVFIEEEGNKGVYEGRAVFFRHAEGVDPYLESHSARYGADVVQKKPITPLKLDPPFKASITFAPPKGCNLEESASHVYTEVAKLGYAMTQGRLFPDSIAESVMGPTFVMVFLYDETPDLTSS